MPAEWELHACTWVAWPHNPETWPGCLETAEQEFETLVATLSRFEPVQILVQDPAHAGQVDERLCRLELEQRVTLHVVPTDDSWLRDIGPTFVIEKKGLRALDWSFNTWGGKYPPWEQDDAAAERIAGLAKVPSSHVSWVIEGGALEVDGAGTLLATRSTLLDPTRNPEIERYALEADLERVLGVDKFIWLDAAIEGDDTDGHIDDIARFVSEGRVVCAREDDAMDPNYAELERCRAQLEAAKDSRGRPLQVFDLPMPPPIEADGDRLPASYANFYFVNGGVIVPTFGVPEDEAALELLRKLCPDRRVVGTPCRTLVRGFGAVHCLTQQQPAHERP